MARSVEVETAAPLIPPRPTLPLLRSLAAGCRACRPWLEAELSLVKPRVLVCLGATAAQALLGRDFKVTRHRGELLRSGLAPYVLATVHPSSLLRAPDEETRRRETLRFVQDLSRIAPLLRDAPQDHAPGP